MELQKLQEQWLATWDEMQRIRWSHISLAAPFVSVPPERARVKPTILLVGKATHRDWFIDSFVKAKNRPILKRIEERENATRYFLKHYAEGHRSAFWALFRSLSKDATVIWTNTTKIGVCRPRDESKPINPWGPFLEAQQKLAELTLQAEVQVYKPDLVFVVTGNDQLNSIIDSIFGSKDRWEQGAAVGKPFWFRQSSGGLPPLLRTGHPGFKTSVERSAWLDKAKELMASKKFI